MKLNTFKCDRCSRLEDGWATSLMFIKQDGGGRYVYPDLCKTCFHEIEQFLVKYFKPMEFIK